MMMMLGMTAAKFKASLPTIIFTLKGISNNSVTVMMPYHNYLESVGDKYQLSVFATETDGAVLGASFMIGSNIIFDVEHNRIGFSYSDCNYQSLKPYTTTSVVVNGTITMPLPPNTPALTEHENSDGSITGPSGAECLELIPKTECTATCEKNAKSYVAQGVMMMMMMMMMYDCMIEMMMIVIMMMMMMMVVMMVIIIVMVAIMMMVIVIQIIMYVVVDDDDV